ncbi:AAA domain-containing protein, putative AbiEii toxin, Type IV TA system [Aromatoleum tolulyticum]|uniref:AAA domain-containing protein, putative AbiEii toxin, Type IV TA system n=1 Tax=Aromatoleum tolulyticum TaxID=34027 RepID=A0A1N6Y1W6_9RHOO|nr:AAA family ATPase [Aromatoleum tolulyticum]SIR08524.1 AAA domain-containing protein, putative AbiEii toxin, Type IV TA system [Aromatoleum tolulyticum]
MIDERAVVTAKFWEALRSLRASSGLRESEFEQFALMVLGLACVAESSWRWADEAVVRTRRFFELLNTEGPHWNEAQFRQVWNDACDALTGIFKADVPREPASSEACHRIVRLLNGFEWSWGSRAEFLTECFDEVFHRVVGRLTGAGYRSGDTAAALAAHLSAHVDRLSEYFATTGECAVLRRTVFDIGSTARVAVIDRLHFLVGLRLALHGINAEDKLPSEGDLASFFGGSFLLVDHPRRNATVRRPHSQIWADQQTSLEALDHLLQNRSDFEVGLIVVPGADRSAGGWRSELRAHLVQSGRLLAVIDLPQERSNRSRKSISAWLLAEGGRSGNDVLMLDAKSLAGSGELRDASLLMEFMAAIVSFGVPEGWPSPRSARSRRSSSDDLDAMLNSFFKDGYRDVEGVCRRVRPSEIEANGFKLAASAYLSNAVRRKTFMSLLNSEPIVAALRRGQDHGTRIYVIGNNGEGKSMLLADLAERLVQQGRRVVGVSFGLTDRFPFERPKNDGQPFIYVGARTSERGIALGRTAADVHRMVREIHVSAPRLNVFDTIVRHLGFGERRYLVPLGLGSSFDDDRARYAELQQLTESADDNARIFQRATPNRYALGLMRQESQSSITTFGELSSGEQQLLILALKLTAYAADSTVILVDEPELSLHVSWQRAIPTMLEIVSSRLGCSIVVATHSPVIVASATHRDDLCFVARRHALTELSLRQRRSVETALFDGFRTYTANNRQVHERCAAMVSQAIQRLNAPSPIQDAELPTVKSLHEELELMERIIQMAGSAQLSHARQDLELVSHTRAALNELVAIEGGGT